MAWYAEHRRDLPWRKRKSLYRTWVSEIMLQQTQVATVVGYYHRFLKRFPTIQKLAAADINEVFQLWEGLGYYRRARQLHRAAQLIVEKHRGNFPRDFAQVLALPGIGRYTAGAILSIADDQRWPILEGNTVRLFSRLLAADVDVTSTVGQKRLWSFAETIVPHNHPGEFNQALMELGNQLCTVTSPRCGECPLSAFCLARQRGTPQNYPIKHKRTRYEDRQELALLVTCQKNRSAQQILVRRCQPNQRWAGLWDLPRLGVEKTLDANDLWNWVHNHHWKVLRQSSWQRQFRHAVTKYRIALDIQELQVKPKRDLPPHHEWIAVSELDQLPLNVTARKVVNYWLDQDQEKTKLKRQAD
jgi:A/G-specific adenine glycosylase